MTYAAKVLLAMMARPMPSIKEGGVASQNHGAEVGTAFLLTRAASKKYSMERA